MGDKALNIIEAMQQHRSIRAYRPDPVADDLLREILEAGIRASSSDERIGEIYREREKKGWERYMAFPRLRQVVEDSGVENLAQLYLIVKYTRKSHKGYSQRVLNYLAEQDFMQNA